MFKIGDRVKVSGEFGGDIRNGIGVIKDVYTFTIYGVRLDNGRYVVVRDGNIFSITTPRQKITQNGYEYELVGQVKPEWLVNGVWVVNTDNGEKRLVKEERPGVFDLYVNDLVSIRYHDGIRNQYRPYEPKDWKWGDRAMYDGKRVFVMAGVDDDKYVAVSFPDIDSYSDRAGDRNWNYIPEKDLTPTF